MKNFVQDSWHIVKQLEAKGHNVRHASFDVSCPAVGQIDELPDEELEPPKEEAPVVQMPLHLISEKQVRSDTQEPLEELDDETEVHKVPEQPHMQVWPARQPVGKTE